MRQVILAAELSLLLLFLFPLALLGGAPLSGKGEAVPEATLPPRPAPASPAPAGESTDGSLSVRVQAEGTLVELTMQEYLWRVVAAEMPASFEPEALKAQAVAARTYTLWKMEHPSASHTEADVCSDISCCKAYITPAAAAATWGTATAH